MKTIRISKLILGLSGVLTGCIVSCSNETPFETASEGVLRMETQYKGDIKVTTRSIEGYTEEVLDQKLVIYVENSKGVIKKFLGKNSIPEFFPLSVGDYVIEGWTGDSASADFSKKFFRAYQPVKINTGANTLALKLNIANVVVSVDKKVLEENITDLNIEVGHPKGVLDFTDTEINEGKKGYFMMPNACSDLNIIITGKDALGKDFTKTEEIKDVKRGYEYNLEISSDETVIEDGGALIRLEIQEIPLVEEYVEILPGPAFKATFGNEPFKLENQVSSLDKDFKDLKVRALVYKGISDLSLNFSSNFKNMESLEGKNLINSTSAQAVWTDAGSGIQVDIKEYQDASAVNKNEAVNVFEAWITFPSTFLNALEDSDTAYEIVMNAKDDRNYKNSVVVNIANTNAALKKPIPVSSGEVPDKNKEPMAILATSATLTGRILLEDAQNYGIKYREQGEDDFIEVKALNTKAGGQTYSVTLTNLKPGKTYEYKAFCDGFEEESINTFQTESNFIFPNHDMSEWSNGYSSSAKKDIVIPSSDGSISFWDSGNHGSATMNVTLTQSDNTFIGNGNIVAKLRSQFVGIGSGSLGKFAAGNLFVGKYAGTSGTNGIIDFGREYNASHPTSVKVMVNYRPGVVESRAADKTHLNSGDTDEGQIYIALTTDIVTVSTADKNTLFEIQKDTDKVIAYGEYTFTGDYGLENKLEELIIDFKYKDIAKTTSPKYLVIVCSASKYGDYFTGGEGSLMYVDDFELEYGDIQWAE